MQRLIGGVQNHFVSRMPEWIMAGILLIEGWILLMPNGTLVSTKAYGPLRAIGTGEQWGAAAAVVGVAWTVALVLNGTFIWFRRISPWVRAICCVATASYMSLFAFGMRIGNPSGDGYLMHGGWAAMALVYSAIIAREVRFADREAVRWRLARQRQTSGIKSSGRPLG